MNLLDLTRRTTPQPWQEGDNIPWDEPGFSERMLQEHLSQAHDAASRRLPLVDQHVAWIHQEMLGGQVGRVLDLGCGPGLYSNRLARLGCECYGIDFSPASIAYARENVEQSGLKCTYTHEDMRRADFGTDFDLAMMIYGEFNVFKPADAALLLDKASRALKPGGRILLEVHTFEVIQHIATEPGVWSAKDKGLFSPRPYVYLEEGFWDETQLSATRRYFIIDAETSTVTRYAASYQGYSDQEYISLLQAHGFTQARLLAGMGAEASPGLQMLTGEQARKDVTLE